jgi:hypothetical protein
VQLISLKGGPLSVGTVWRDGAVDDETADKFLHSFQKIIGQLAENQIARNATLKELD